MNTEIFTIQEKREKTELVLSNVFNLPSVPALMIEINKLFEKPQVTNAELAKVIGRDQGIASKVLSIANSPFYGLPRKVSTIDFAIIIIGFQDIRNIVTALSMVEAFKNKSDKGLNQKDFWLHSILTGLAAKKIAEDLGYRSGSEAFVAGLIHDLGISVMHKYFHTAFMRIRQSSEESQKGFIDCETSLLGMDHQEVGKFLAVRWNLPPALCDTILNHHCPVNAKENRYLTSVVHLADYLTHALGTGDFYWDRNFGFDESVLETLALETMDRVGEFLNNYREMLIQEASTIRF